MNERPRSANPQAKARAKAGAKAGAGTAQRVPAAAVVGLIADALMAVDFPPADAQRIGELMTEADLTGADAHGVFRLPQYVERARAGGINRHPNIAVNRSAPATALVDGDNGMGHLVMARVAETAIELARENGVAWVGARNSNHAGAAGVYAAMALEHDMVGVYAAVASANHMAVWGGAEALLGTNPLAVAIPAGEEAPVVLDIATSVVSYGTVKNHRLKGEPLEPGWMVNTATGEPITDARRSDEGLLLPIGGYKGSGLSLILGLLCGPLNGARFGRDIVDFNADQKSLTNTGQLIIALDVKRFAPIGEFKAEIDRHARSLRASQPLPGVDAIRLPGEARAERRRDRLHNGVPLIPELLAQLDKLAAALRIIPVRDR
jgi:LDH2 family malate/lactate/ureidoglycolate dehydrogenase